MKRLSILIITILFAFPALSQMYMNMDFYNSNGKKYNTKTFNEQLEKEYNAKFNYYMIIVVTPSLIDLQFRKQNSIFNEFNAENPKMIFITSCKSQERIGGYYTSTRIASVWLKNPDKCSFFVLDPTSKIILESDKIVTKENILKAIEKNKKLTGYNST